MLIRGNELLDLSCSRRRTVMRRVRLGSRGQSCRAPCPLRGCCRTQWAGPGQAAAMAGLTTAVADAVGRRRLGAWGRRESARRRPHEEPRSAPRGWGVLPCSGCWPMILHGIAPVTTQEAQTIRSLGSYSQRSYLGATPAGKLKPPQRHAAICWRFLASSTRRRTTDVGFSWRPA
jgi:hypothetical protein